MRAVTYIFPWASTVALSLTNMKVAKFQNVKNKAPK